MARAPFNVLVIPHRSGAFAREFAVFHRCDSDMWQFIAGGGEDDESPLQAAKREAFEEGGITEELPWIQLDSIASVPRTAFPSATWPSAIFVIPQYSFGVCTDSIELQLSHEHDALDWLSYDEAHRRLTWDSNRVALWELEQRLQRTG